MKLRERDYWLGFNIFPGIGPKRFHHLLSLFGSAKKAWQAPREKLKQTLIPRKILMRFFEFRKTINFSSEILRLEKSLIRFLIIGDKEYPENLKHIDLPPPLIYIRGQILPEDKFSIAVIGTRKITAYGREVTERLVSGLTAHGFTIVSGLARGVDSVAHRVALGNKGRTIAVLGSGILNIYPPEHKVLAEKIVSLNLGALISELPLGAMPLRGNFPSRNRIISGLSLGVLVTEGTTVSGTKITADYCFRQERKLFAVPGPITSPLSEGPADLIKKGAKLVTKVDDILKEIEARKVKVTSQLKTSESKKPNFENKDEEEIFQLLLFGSKHIDEIVKGTKLTSSQVLSHLTAMELQGMVKNIGQGNYILAL
ncbi:MAG TPA: DNA-processing protein DprA, partial [Candidatus Bathyarchaeia archaeon]|nr:DNA-processing protein DprA [Candidatus Bathyarchaeia archaeon]